MGRLGILIALPILALSPSRPGGPLRAQELSVERIFASPDFRPEGLVAVEWLRDGERFSYLEGNEETGWTDLWVEDAATGRRTRVIDGSRLVPPGETAPIRIEGYRWSPDGSRLLLFTRSRRVWRLRTKGVYYVYELESGSLRPLSTAFGWQQFAKFSPDGRRVGFVRDHDLFVVDLESGRERRLTRDGSDVIINGTFDWVYEEELGLRDGWRWSPDGRRIAFWRLDQSTVKTFYLLDQGPLYPRLVPIRYPKAGEANSRVRIGVVDVESGEVTWIDTGDNPDDYLARMEWAASSSELVIQRLNRHQNRLDVLLADVTTGAARVLLSETDDAWVDVDDDLVWVRDGAAFLWSSERDGFNHLYLYRRDGTLVRQLTRGPWDVRQLVGVDEAGGWVYFTAGVETPLRRELHRVPLDGGPRERVSRRPGTHAATLAPGGRYYLDVFSAAGTPPVTSLHRAGGERLRVLVDNAPMRARLDSLRLRAPEFFTFTTSEGVELNGWLIKPPDFDPGRRYPVLLYVYGGPGSQTVTDAWGGTRYLWHQLLARRGYIVASVDNRGTGGRGREFRKATYLRLGVLESRDQVEAARHLASLPYVDPGRIGIWGWSYGGYMTALTMMRGGELFRAGIAVAPVTDWKLYDTIYTERYMRTPLENPDGYREGSPLHQVEGLEGDLLLVHGTGDDNVHFQNTVRLVDALEAAGKRFSLMIYPNRTHSIAGGRTRVHLFELMTEWIVEHL